MHPHHDRVSLRVAHALNLEGLPIATSPKTPRRQSLLTSSLKLGQDFRPLKATQRLVKRHSTIPRQQMPLPRQYAAGKARPLTFISLGGKASSQICYAPIASQARKGCMQCISTTGTIRASNAVAQTNTAPEILPACPLANTNTQDSRVTSASCTEIEAHAVNFGAW